MAPTVRLGGGGTLALLVLGLHSAASGAMPQLALTRVSLQESVPALDRKALGNMAGGRKPRADGKMSVQISRQHAQIAEIFLGTPPQKLRCLIDTGSSDLWVPSKRCGRCQNDNNFDADASSTFRPDLRDTPYGQRPRAVKISYGSGQVVGYAVHDTLQFGSLHIPNQAFLIVEDAALPRGRKWDGICGLGWQGLAQVRPTMYENVKRLGHPALFVIVPASGAGAFPAIDGKSSAHMVLGELPTPAMKPGTLVWTPAEPYDPTGSGMDDQRTFWMISGGLKINAKHPVPARFLVDTGTNQVLLVPQRHYEMFIRSLIPPQLFDKMCGDDPNAGVICDCDIMQYQGLNPLQIVIQGEAFALPLSKMFMKANARDGGELCLLTIQPNDISGGGMGLGDIIGSLLGSLFGPSQSPGISNKVIPEKSGNILLPPIPFHRPQDVVSEHDAVMDEMKFQNGVRCQDTLVIEKGQLEHKEVHCQNQVERRSLQSTGPGGFLGSIFGGDTAPSGYGGGGVYGDGGGYGSEGGNTYPQPTTGGLLGSLFGGAAAPESGGGAGYGGGDGYEGNEGNSYPQPTTDPNEFWMLGGVFLEHFVTVFDFDHGRLGFAEPAGGILRLEEVTAIKDGMLSLRPTHSLRSQLLAVPVCGLTALAATALMSVGLWRAGFRVIQRRIVSDVATDEEEARAPAE